jgi:NAD(P)-dependent dehydrogenase (short-subunit alcohol dehydrogenase family)
MFQDQVAIVTGGGSGIGAELCRQLARQGARLVVADIDPTRAEQLASSLGASGGRARPLAVDVTDAAAVRRLVEETASHEGRVDLLFNNAGVGIGGEVQNLSLEDWRRILDVNLWGVIHGVHAAYPVMLRQRSGHIVNTASAAGLLAVPMMAPYAAAKHAVVGLSRALRAEAADHGIRVSVVCPGFIRTNIFDASRYVGLGRDDLLLRLPFRMIEVDEAVRRILRGVQRNQALISFPFYARFFSRLQVLFPRLCELLALKSVRDVRRARS